MWRTLFILIKYSSHYTSFLRGQALAPWRWTVQCASVRAVTLTYNSPTQPFPLPYVSYVIFDCGIAARIECEPIFLFFHSLCRMATQLPSKPHPGGPNCVLAPFPMSLVVCSVTNNRVIYASRRRCGRRDRKEERKGGRESVRALPASRHIDTSATCHIHIHQSIAVSTIYIIST